MTVSPLDGQHGGAEDIEPLMATSRVVSAVVVRSLAHVRPAVTVAQLRVLVMVGESGSLSMNEVAEGLSVNPSNASRRCDRLIELGLLAREEDPDDRRRVAVTVTPAGRQLLEEVMEQRRRELEGIVTGMRPNARRRLMSALQEFVQAAGMDRRADALVGDLWDRAASQSGAERGDR